MSLEWAEPSPRRVPNPRVRIHNAYSLRRSGLAAAVVPVCFSGCVDNSTPSAGGSDEASAPAIAADDAAIALPCEGVGDDGKLVIGIDPTYAPNEFKDADGNPIGWGC